jgi:glycosyltransferase involved in cell wall biosynthesis
VRILTVGNMYPPHHLGGYELTWRSAVEHLRGEGHEVLVLTTDYRNAAPAPGAVEDPDVRRELRWYWHDHDFPPISVRERVALERHNGRVLERALAELRPDVVSWWAMGGMSLSLIERVRRAGLPAVGVVGDAWMAYGPKVDAWTRLVRRLGPLGLVAGAVAGVPARLELAPVTWLFNSEATRAVARGAGFRLDHTEVVNPGVDTGLYRPAPEHDWAWRLLYVGRIDERKGIDLAVEALAELPEEAVLTVLGSGDDTYLGELRALAERLGVAARVEFGQRPREQLPVAYAEADALLFPARWEEPWGLVPLEAMAVGTPVVATGTGGSGEYLRDRDNALVVGADAGALAGAVRHLAADADLRGRLRGGGFETAARYSERAYNEAIAAALERAAE